MKITSDEKCTGNQMRYTKKRYDYSFYHWETKHQSLRNNRYRYLGKTEKYVLTILKKEEKKGKLYKLGKLIKQANIAITWRAVVSNIKVCVCVGREIITGGCKSRGAGLSASVIAYLKEVFSYWQEWSGWHDGSHRNYWTVTYRFLNWTERENGFFESHVYVL